MSNRNMVRQVVPLKNEEGDIIGHKPVFHKKKMNSPQYASFKNHWDYLNGLPKENSKRQRKLRGELA